MRTAWIPEAPNHPGLYANESGTDIKPEGKISTGELQPSTMSPQHAKQFATVRRHRRITFGRTPPMKLAAILSLLISLSASSQTTQPSLPILAWYQPLRNLPAMAAMGITTVVGPEVENGRNLPPDVLASAQLAWIKGTQDLGLNCILKKPTGPLPVNCVGIIFKEDEPNGHLIPPSAMLGSRDDLRARYPGTPLLLNLSGDKITSANFRAADQVQLYKDYGDLCDVLMVDWYSKNRNADRYSVTLTAAAVKTLKTITGKPVIAWCEANDQRLPPIGAGTANRAPTPDEIKQTVDAAVAAGASGIGWFMTCDKGNYGWPQSYLPMIDRNGISMRPQYDAVRTISISLAGPPLTPTPAPTTAPEVLKLQADVAELRANQAKTDAALEAQTAKVRAAAEALR